jgi:hypothetical protein
VVGIPFRRWVVKASALFPVVIVIASFGCQSGDTQDTPPVETATGPRITGPYAHENLAVYLIHADRQDDREFITLDEGLRDKVVLITEKQDEQVSELQIENTAEVPLFIQEGDRLVGGKQDRIIGLSMVIPPRSGKTKIPAFCVEQGRWAQGGMGLAFGATSNAALAPLPVRYAGKVAGDQGMVWREVAEQKSVLEEQGVSNASSSLNEAFDSEEMNKVSREYQSRLGEVFEEHPDAVGVAFALNGEIQEVNLYPGNRLLRKIGPRLLMGYAIQAVASREGKATHPAAPDVAKFMQDGTRRKEESRQIDGRNSMRLISYDGKVNCDTLYEGKPVHVQWAASQ